MPYKNLADERERSRRARAKAAGRLPVVEEKHPLETHTTRTREQKLAADNKVLLRDLAAAQSRLADLSSAKPIKVPAYKPFPSHAKRRMTAVVLASDWHVEETVTAQSTDGRNEYNLDIAERRIERFFQAILWNLEHQRASGHLAIDDLVLWLGGDLISGYIHEELRELNALSPTKTVLWLIPRLVAGIKLLAQKVRLRIVCSRGNHGRTTMKTQISTGAANSFEWQMYKTLEMLLPSIPWNITEAAHQHEMIHGRKIHFHHGDETRGGGGIGGLAPPLLRRVATWNMNDEGELHCIGHYHQFIDFGPIIVNGSLIGYNAYARSISARFEPPQQAMFYIDEKRGKTMLTGLWVGERA